MSKSAVEKVFEHNPADSDPWNAYRDAEEWVRSQGYSVGAMQSGSPTALFKGDCRVSKWRNLTAREQHTCDGTITALSPGRFRETSVLVHLKSS